MLPRMLPGDGQRLVLVHTIRVCTLALLLVQVPAKLGSVVAPFGIVTALKVGPWFNAWCVCKDAKSQLLDNKRGFTRVAARITPAQASARLNEFSA